jgi:hypothetical protein
MARRFLAPLLAVVVIAVVLVPSPASAAVGRAPKPAFCNAFAQYFDLSFQIQFVKAFAGATGDETAQEQVGDVFVLILSPKLENLTSTMADTAPRPIRSLFADQAQVFARGSDALEDLGITRQQIETLAKAPVDLSNEDLNALLGEVDVSEQDLEAAAAEFDGDAVLETAEASPAKQASFERAIQACGIVPITGLDCDELVTPDEAAAALGSAAQVDTENGSCVYVGSAQDTGDPAELTVEVYEGSRAYQRLTQDATNQSVPGLGERATAIEGYATFSSTKTCGRTIVADDGERTVVVALCVPDVDDEAPIGTLTDVTTSVLDRVGA